MFLPSPLYILAAKDIADSHTSTPSDVLAILICAITVMLFIEIPLVAMFVRPAGVAAAIERFHDWLKRNRWTLAAVLSLIAGIYATVKASTSSAERQRSVERPHPGQRPPAESWLRCPRDDECRSRLKGTSPVSQIATNAHAAHCRRIGPTVARGAN
jgi:Sap, sulfolipid-1-addressing protein